MNKKKIIFIILLLVELVFLVGARIKITTNTFLLGNKACPIIVEGDTKPTNCVPTNTPYAIFAVTIVIWILTFIVGYLYIILNSKLSQFFFREHRIFQAFWLCVILIFIPAVAGFALWLSVAVNYFLD